jgi:hypothetical protein
MIFWAYILPIVAVNVWHSLLILTRMGSTRRPDSLSEQAGVRPRFLLIHKIVHCCASALFIVFSYEFLWQQERLILPAILFSFGAFLDIAQVLTLNKHTKHTPSLNNLHILTAWPMAICYMAFGALLSREAGMSVFVVHGMWVTFIILLLIAIKMQFKYFWVTQHGYFLILSVQLIISVKSLF